MSGQRYPEEFKIEAVKQVTDRGHSVADVADRLGVTSHSIYNWLKKYGPKAAAHEANTEEAKKIKSVEKELKRVTEERDILKKAAEDSSHQSNSYTKILICMRTLNETVKAYIYHRREKPCF